MRVPYRVAPKGGFLSQSFGVDGPALVHVCGCGWLKVVPWPSGPRKAAVLVAAPKLVRATTLHNRKCPLRDVRGERSSR